MCKPLYIMFNTFPFIMSAEGQSTHYQAKAKAEIANSKDMIMINVNPYR